MLNAHALLLQRDLSKSSRYEIHVLIYEKMYRECTCNPYGKNTAEQIAPPADLLPAVPGVGGKRKLGIGQLLLPVFQRRKSLFTRIKRRRLSLSCRYELLEQQHVCIEL